MEIQERQPTLVKALDEWNHTEDMFRNVFGDDALKDKDFKKMKLREYDRIWHAFNGKPLSKDERSLMAMLRFQRKKLRRTLYPGLLTRLLNRAGSYIRHLLSDTPAIAVPRNSDDHRYAENILRFEGREEDNGRPKKQGRYERRYNNHSHDLGARKDGSQNRRHGQTM